uniref:MPN domain-containing protein n=1 Tax=Aureoumbra lagunensis TaxID=44058 RepID=A0A7S3NMR9_9STRA|mmetsp:Transcript_16478/g.21487  ORF Transcript_16478/g.21487 Transcript_16478/m.21487 type:complete len:382 (+) Transcript_16478:28-1173(+)
MADREGSITQMGAQESGEKSVSSSNEISRKMAQVLAMHVVVHPLVLLSTVDHYNRVAKDTKKRVVGILLGTRSRNVVDVTNSFAVPFEEDLKNPSIWYLDHNYLETMYRMYKKVNARENIVGFYSSGPKIKENDIKIDELVRKYNTQGSEELASAPPPAFVIIDVRPENDAIPTTAYASVEEVDESAGGEQKKIRRAFKHISSAIGAYEAEEVGVEHLLRDVNDPTVSTLANQIKHKMTALNTLRAKLAETKHYLELVLTDKLPVNNQIVYNLQEIFNLLPNLNIDSLVTAMLVKTNDMHLAVYCAALVRCIIALHALVNNKITNKSLENSPSTATTEDDSSKNNKDTNPDSSKDASSKRNTQNDSSSAKDQQDPSASKQK